MRSHAAACEANEILRLGAGWLDATGADRVGCAPVHMNPFHAQLLGILLLVLRGDGVVANVVLSRSKGQNTGWIVIAGGAGGATIAVNAVNTLARTLTPPSRSESRTSAGSSGCACPAKSSRSRRGLAGCGKSARVWTA